MEASCVTQAVAFPRGCFNLSRLHYPPLNLQPSNLLASRALELAVEFRHPIYDMLYCALAIENDCEFVTADNVLVSKLSRRLPFVRLLTTIDI